MDPVMVGFGDTVRLANTAVGTVRFIGYTDFDRDILFYGIKLQSASGENDGKIRSRRYFKCPKLHGIFVRREDIVEVISAKHIDKPFSIGQRVQIIDSLQNNRKIGKGRLRFVGLTSLDHFRHYLYGVELDRYIKPHHLDHLRQNPHIFLMHDAHGGYSANPYFDGDAKRSIFVRRDQLKVILREKERRHSAKHQLRGHHSLRNRHSNPMQKGGRKVDRRARSRSVVPRHMSRLSSRKRFPDKSKPDHLLESPSFDSLPPLPRKSPKSRRTQSSSSSSSGLVVLSSYESTGDFNGCLLAPDYTSQSTPIRPKQALKPLSELKLNSAMSLGRFAERQRVQSQRVEKRTKSTNVNPLFRPQAVDKGPCGNSMHRNTMSVVSAFPPTQSGFAPHSLSLKKRHSTPIRGDDRRRMLMMAQQELRSLHSGAIREDEPLCFGEGNARNMRERGVDDDDLESIGSSLNYEKVINDRDKFERFVDRKHVYYHEQFANRNKDRDAEQLLAAVKQRSQQAPPPTMGSFFSSRSLQNRRKKRSLPRRPTEYLVEINRRPMGFFIETKPLNEDGGFKMVNAYISSIVDEEWCSKLLIGSQLLGINEQDITGLSFCDIFRKLTTVPLPFALRLAAPTEKNSEGKEQSEEERIRGVTVDETKLSGHQSVSSQRKNRLKFRFKIF